MRKKRINQARVKVVGNAVLHYCPACKSFHLPTGTMRGTLEYPSVSGGSIRIYKRPGDYYGKCCHYFLVDGYIFYWGDCNHKYADKIVRLPTVDQWKKPPKIAVIEGKSANHGNYCVMQSYGGSIGDYRRLRDVGPLPRYLLLPDGKINEALLKKLTGLSP